MTAIGRPSSGWNQVLAAAAYVAVAGTLFVRPAFAQEAAMLAEIDRTMESYRLDRHIPGMVWGIVKDGRLIHVKGAGMQDIVTKQVREVLLGQGRLAIAPGIVGDEPRSVRQQLTNANLGRVVCRVLPSAQLWHMSFHRCVERESAIVAQLRTAHQSKSAIRHHHLT